MMNRHNARPAICLTLALFMVIILACSIGLPGAEDDISTATPPAPAGEAQVNEAEGPAPKSPPTQPESQPTSPIRPAEAARPTAPSIKPVADKWSLWVNGPHLRGADLHPCRVFAPDECIRLTTRQDVRDLRDMGANLINASYPGVFTEGPPYQVDPAALAYLDDLIGWAEDVGIFVVIHFRTGPGRNEAAIHLADDALYFEPPLLSSLAGVKLNHIQPIQRPDLAKRRQNVMLIVLTRYQKFVLDGVPVVDFFVNRDGVIPAFFLHTLARSMIGCR